MKILCIGHASYDISMPLEEYPIENIKYRVNEKIECGGGPASTAAYLLGSFGVPTVFKGVVGNDIFGRRIVSEFKEIGVDTRYIEVNNKVDTTISFIIINKKNGSRTVFNYASSYPMLRNNEYDFYPDFILIDGHNYRGSKLALEKFPNAISVIDAGRDAREVIELAGMVNYLVCSKEFAEKVSNIKIDFNNKKTLIDVYEYLKNKFKNIIVITLEDKGCFIKDDDGYKLITAVKVTPKDTTGAGDIFHGAFLYALTKNMSLMDACKFSNICAGLSLRHIGTRNSIPNLKEVEEIFYFNEKAN